MTERPEVLIPLPTSADYEYNRVCWPQYAAAVWDAGGVAVEAALSLRDSELRALAVGCSGILLPGSPADVSPELYGHAREPACGMADAARERCDRTLLEHGLSRSMPVLGICYGMQSLNVYLGGTLIQDIACRPVNHAAGPSVAVAHAAVVEKQSRLGAMVEGSGIASNEDSLRMMINSSHHQALGIPGDGLRIVARSAEDLVVEAVEGPKGEPFLLGVQWHPERSVNDSAVSRAILSEFVLAAATWSAEVAQGRTVRQTP